MNITSDFPEIALEWFSKFVLYIVFQNSILATTELKDASTFALTLGRFSNIWFKRSFVNKDQF